MRAIYLVFLIKLLIPLTSCEAQVDPTVQPGIRLFKISQGSPYPGTEIGTNGTTHNLVLSQQLGRVELVCRADRPIKWEYLYNEKPLPILEVEYKRVLTNPALSVQELKDPLKNTFQGRLTLRGLLESQTGKYVCRYYNSRLTNNSYEGSAHLNLFVPGKRTFNEVTHVKFINKTDPFVVIPCPVSDPSVHVRLYKLNEEIFNRSREIKWKSIYTGYDPSVGFHLEGGLGRSLLGAYNCTADNGQSIKQLVADVSAKAEYEAHLLRSKSCWETEDFLRLTRSKRLECFCKDSYALFVDEITLEEENRRGDCESVSTWLPSLDNNCSDWRLEEFFKNGEDSPEICFRDGIRDMFNGTGTRFILRAMTKSPSSPLTPWLRNITVLYDGLPTWASGFKLGLEIGSKVNGTPWVQIIDQEPRWTGLYPLAHFRAVWEDLIIDTRLVSKIHVFQADSFSFEWFEVSKAIPLEPETSNKTRATSRAESSPKVSTLILLVLAVGIFKALISDESSFIR